MEEQEFRPNTFVELKMPQVQEPKHTLAAQIFLGLVLLKGEEGRDYLILEKNAEAWELLGWIRRN